MRPIFFWETFLAEIAELYAAVQRSVIEALLNFFNAHLLFFDKSGFLFLQFFRFVMFWNHCFCSPTKQLKLKLWLRLVRSV